MLCRAQRRMHPPRLQEKPGSPVAWCEQLNRFTFRGCQEQEPARIDTTRDRDRLERIQLLGTQLQPKPCGGQLQSCAIPIAAVHERSFRYLEVGEKGVNGRRI